MKKSGYKIAVVGATGLVGRAMIKVLEESTIPFEELFLFASERSAEQEIPFKGKLNKVKNIETTDFKGIDIALFSAGKDVSVKYAPSAARNGCIVIDNGSYWRMHPQVPLVVPEVNPKALLKHKGIIANPNCSTIQLVVALEPLQKSFGIKRLVVSTYQSITGAGQKGLDHLFSEIEGKEPKKRVSSHQVAFNTVFHEITDESGFSVEEIKMKNEIRKIMDLPKLPIAVTCVRLPVLGGHGESVNLKLENTFDIQQIRNIFRNSPGIILVDEPIKEKYPTTQLSSGRNEVFVGRLRIDDSVRNGLYLWVVADNVRKGAATNAVQIAEQIINDDLFEFTCFDF